MFDDIDFGDTHDSEANDYNPYDSEANDYNPYDSETNDYSPYDSNADSDASYLGAVSEESQNGILGDSPFSSSFGGAPSENLDATGAEDADSSSSDDGDAPVRFGASGFCRKCDCRSFEWPTSGNICQNCYHHYDEHL